MHPTSLPESLRANETRAAPADDIVVTVAHRPAGPVTAWAACRIGSAIAVVNDITGLRTVIALIGGDSATDDGCAEQACTDANTEAAAAAARVGSRGYAQGSNRNNRGRGDRKN